jgi:hypothetical protein
MQTYPCANCKGSLAVADNINGGLITVNVNGHAKAAHRTCPNFPEPTSPPRDPKDVS